MLLLALLLFLIITIIPQLNKWRKQDHFKYGNALGIASIAAIPFAISSDFEVAAAVGAI